MGNCRIINIFAIFSNNRLLTTLTLVVWIGPQLLPLTLLQITCTDGQVFGYGEMLTSKENLII